MTKKALLIGCNYIGSDCELRGCINDVLNIKKFLIQEQGFKETEIRVMTEASDDPNNIPNKVNILAALASLVKDNGPDSRLFLHYSGHGSWVYDRNGDEKDGRDETICPIDYANAGMIVDDQLRKILADSLNPGAQLFFLCDCCHSGTMADLKYTYRINAIGTQTIHNVISDSKYAKTRGNIICVSGCTDLQTSADAYLPELSNPQARGFQGALTYCFLSTYSALKKQGPKSMSYKDIMKGLLRSIRQRGFSQVPQISSGQFIDLNTEFKII